MRQQLSETFSADPDIDLVMLDDGQAHSASARSRSLQALEESDFAVFLLGATYSEDTTITTSITEDEFDRAMDLRSKGAGLVVQVWSLEPDIIQWDQRAVRFLSKAQTEQVVGRLGQHSNEEAAHLVAASLREAVDRFLDEEFNQAGSTFIDSAREVLRVMSLSIDPDPKRTASDPNEFRRAGLSQRDNVLSTIKSVVDLSWMEAQLREVRVSVPTDLLTNVLLVLVYLHRDRPSDRIAAASVARLLRTSIEFPDTVLSADTRTRRDVELVALAARTLRLASVVGEPVDLDSTMQSLDEAHRSTPISRAVLSERVMWANMALSAASREGERQERETALFGALKDLVFVYPGYAASLVETQRVPDRVVEQVQTVILQPTAMPRSSLPPRPNLRRALQTIRTAAESGADELSVKVVSAARIARSVEESATALSKAVALPGVGARLVSPESIQQLELELASRESTLMQELQVNEGATGSTGPRTTRIGAIMAEVDRLEIELNSCEESLPARRFSKLVSRLHKMKNKWAQMLVVAMVGGSLLGLGTYVWSVATGRVPSLDWLTESEQYASLQDFAGAVGFVVALLAMIGAAAYGAYWAGVGGAMVGAMIAPIVLLFAALALGVFLVVALAGLVSLAIGYVSLRIAVAVIDAPGRGRTSSIEKQTESLRRRQKRLSELLGVTESILALESATRRSLEENQRKLGELRLVMTTLVSEYNRKYAVHPAIYNKEYVPSERAKPGDLTRSPSTNQEATMREVIGRRLVWAPALFLPLPLTRQAVATIESEDLQKWVVQLLA